ncbi:MAG TPA: peptide ABC transporter substrate-binding protein [Anaerolineae bacterium]
MISSRSLCYRLCFVFLALGGALVLAACSRSSGTTSVVTEYVVVEGEERVVTRLVRQTVTVTPAAVSTVSASPPVELDISFTREERPVIDPQKTDDPDGVDLIENLFVGLTRYNHESNRIEPELAREWEVSGNGRVWTFHLRDDIFWVRPADRVGGGLGDAEPVRPVIASDVVFAVQRACARETNTPYAFILFLVVGCEQVNQSAAATPADLEGIGVRALNDVTLEVTLTKPASHFLTMTSMWLFYPVPREMVVEHGDEWTAAENLLTSGPFFPIPQSQTLYRNPLWPLPRRGNVDIVNIFYLNDEMGAFQLWQSNQLDLAPLPAAERENFLQSPAAEKALLVTDQTVFYLAYNFESGVFREPEVRRAFSAAIDRERLVEEIFGQQALGMRHLTPPGVLLAPPIDEIGVGYSPDYARQQLAASGFDSCRLMPDITFLVSSSDLSLRQAEIIRRMWVQELGCAEEQIVIEQVQFGALLANTRADAGSARPDVWELGWASYYPDAYNWAGDLLHCQESENRQNRSCSEVDELIRQMSSAVEFEQRYLLYREVENMFFGAEGVVPLAPLYVRGDFVLVQSWLNYAPALFGGEQYETYIIDAGSKRLERSR